jgi:hypothetical protein
MRLRTGKCSILKAVHEGLIASLSLVRINILSKPLLRPGWRQVLQYKYTDAVVQFICKAVQLGTMPDY